MHMHAHISTQAVPSPWELSAFFNAQCKQQKAPSPGQQQWSARFSSGPVLMASGIAQADTAGWEVGLLLIPVHFGGHSYNRCVGLLPPIMKMYTREEKDVWWILWDHTHLFYHTLGRGRLYTGYHLAMWSWTLPLAYLDHYVRISIGGFFHPQIKKHVEEGKPSLLLYPHGYLCLIYILKSKDASKSTTKR